MLIYDLNANPLNSNEWAFPLTECFHITSSALSIGMIALVDLRLLGLAFKRQTAGQLVKDTGIWTLAGLIIVIISGLLIFSSDPIRYINNSGYVDKMALLVLAIIYGLAQLTSRRAATCAPRSMPAIPVAHCSRPTGRSLASLQSYSRPMAAP